MPTIETIRIRYLGEADIARAGVGPGEMADAIAEAFLVRGQGRVQIPPKVILKSPAGASFYAMSASVAGGVSGLKWLAATNRQADGRTLPSFLGLAILSDSATGLPRAVLSASSITADRTAAISLLASRHLAVRDARVLGLVGCGAQARSHLRAFAGEFPLRRALLAGRGRANIDATSALARELGLDVEICDDVASLLRRSQIVTSSVPPQPGVPPILDARMVPPGGFITMVDHGASWKAEGLIGLDALYTDDVAATRDRADVEPHLAAMTIDADLTAIGSAFRRRSGEERIGFVFAGTALADLAVCKAILDRAEAKGLGTMLDL